MDTPCFSTVSTQSGLSLLRYILAFPVDTSIRMKKMDLGQTLQILANFGVIAGIVFLAIEIRQNTDSQRMLAAQQVFGTSNATIHAQWAG